VPAGPGTTGGAALAARLNERVFALKSDKLRRFNCKGFPQLAGAGGRSGLVGGRAPPLAGDDRGFGAL
jgi:hypothetical protein